MSLYPKHRVVRPWPPPNRNAATHTLQPLSRPSAIDCYAADVYTPVMDPTISNGVSLTGASTFACQYGNNLHSDYMSTQNAKSRACVYPVHSTHHCVSGSSLQVLQDREVRSTFFSLDQSETQYAASVSHQSNELNVWSTERYTITLRSQTVVDRGITPLPQQ
ncbi:hypothetical protein BU17DRAFT_60723 [Hysterangium stoloniferum]|nr:hypothetical protein BU17DRAFT_60723 [Hysterangium stoloniferum]